MTKRIISVFLLMLIWISSIAPLPSNAKYTGYAFATQNLNLTISNEEVPDGMIYINYYTYDGTSNVRVAQDIYYNLDSIVTIRGEADVAQNKLKQEGHTFLGWSVSGINEVNGNTHIGLYGENDTVKASVLQAENGLYRTYFDLVYDINGNAIGANINLYDIYDKNTITIKPHHLDTEIDDNMAYSLVSIASWDSMADVEYMKQKYITNTSVSEGDPMPVVVYRDATYTEELNNGNDDIETTGRYGVFAGLKPYYLTSYDDMLQFYFHPGITFSSSLIHITDTGEIQCFLCPGLFGKGEYKYISGDSTKAYDVLAGLFEDDTAETYEELLSTVFMGRVLTDDNHIFYSFDATPADAVERTDIGYNSNGEVNGIDIACFATGTLITLADGSKIPVEELTQDHMLQVYDHENGVYTSAPPLLINYDGDKEYMVATLSFADGEELKIINERGLFDLTLNRYAYITPENCNDYIGHLFAKETSDGFEAVMLTDAYAQTEYTGCYSVTSTYYINHFINGYLTVPGGFHWFVNYFEYGDNLKYDEEAMARDIEMYGLYTVDDFAEYVSEDMLFLFDTIYPAKYLKVTVGKGLARFDEILTVIKDWIIYYDLTGRLESLKKECAIEIRHLENAIVTSIFGEPVSADNVLDENGNAQMLIKAINGAVLPPNFEIAIGEDTYIIYTDISEQENGIIWDNNNGCLTIPGDLINDTATIIILQVQAILPDNKEEEEPTANETEPEEGEAG